MSDDTKQIHAYIKALEKELATGNTRRTLTDKIIGSIIGIPQMILRMEKVNG
jgi:hypothetical protein